MRTKWQNGTVLYTQEGARYKITASNEAGGTAIIYYAEKAGSGIRRVLKEFYPEGWERRKGVPVRSEYLDCPDDDNGLLSCYESLVELAEREMDISQKIAQETAHVWPVRGMLKVEKVCEPDGTVWQMEGGLPCCILEMDNLNHRDGRWIQDILREATERKGEDTPLGNLQEPESEPVLAVPPLEVTLMVVWHLLVLLAKIHAAGYLHGDINLGNVFMVLDDKGEKIENAMLIDFGSARELVNGVTAPLGEDAVMATPGFCAPELRDGGGEQRLTPKADVYSVGKLMHCLLDQNILEALRNGWYSDVADELENPTLDPSGINDARVNPAVRKSLDRILAGAAEEEPEKRSSVREMLDEVVQLYWKAAPPAWQMSLSLPKLNEDEVLGREKDVKTVENALWEDNTLVLHGFSGIGKTKFVTLLGHEWERDYPGSRAYYAFFPGSMTGLVVDTLAQHISTVELEETRNGKNVPRAADAIIGDVFRELNAHMHEQDLLIIDNVDSDTVGWEELVHDEDAPGRTDLFQRFDELQCRVVFVTRMNLQDAKGIVPLEVPELEEKPLRAILRKYSDDAEKRSDDELDALIELVERHTMTVDIVARTMKRSRLTVPEIYEELSRGDYDSDAFVEVAGEKENDRKERKIEGHLVRLFRLAGFNEREQEVLRYAQLIGETSGMYEKLFLYCCPHKAKGENAQNIKALDHLIQLGYVQQKKENGTEEVILNLHTLVRVVAKKEMAITPEQCDAFLKPMEKFHGFSGTLLDELNYSLDYWLHKSCGNQIYQSFMVASVRVSATEKFLPVYWRSFGLRWIARGLDVAENAEFFLQLAILENFFDHNSAFIQNPSEKFLPDAAKFCENLFYLVDTVTSVQSLLSDIDTEEKAHIFVENHPDFFFDFPLLDNEPARWKAKRTFYGELAVSLLLKQTPLDEFAIIALYTQLSFDANPFEKLKYTKQRLKFEQLRFRDVSNLLSANLEVAEAYNEVGEKSESEPYYKICFELLENTKDITERDGAAITLLKYCDLLKHDCRYEEALFYNLKLEKFIPKFSLRTLLEERAEYYYFLGQYENFIKTDNQLDNPRYLQVYRSNSYAHAIRNAQKNGDVKWALDLKKQQEDLHVPTVKLGPVPDFIEPDS